MAVKLEEFPNRKKARKIGLNASVQKNWLLLYSVLGILIAFAGYVHYIADQKPVQPISKPDTLNLPVTKLSDVQINSMSSECEQKMDDMVDQLKKEIKLSEKQIEKKLEFFSDIEEKLNALKHAGDIRDKKIEEREKEQKMRDNLQNVAIEMLAREGTSNKAIRDSIEYKLNNLEKELENLILNFEGQSEKLEQFIEKNSQELVEMRIAVQDRSKVVLKSENENEHRWDFENQIQDLRTEITMLQADKTGMADFALEATGAQILPGNFRLKFHCLVFKLHILNIFISALN